MKQFSLIPCILECGTVREMAEALSLGARDLILTNAYIYNPTFAALDLPCHTLFQEEFGSGEPTDVMVDSILSALAGKDFDRIIAVGGGTVIDIAKALCVAGKGDTVDALYDRMADLKKEHGLVIVPTTCGTGSEVTNISIINRTTRGIKQGLVHPSMYADDAVLVPELLASLPYPVFATSSIDAMIHAVESFLSPNASPLSELFSTAALRLILSGYRAIAGQDKDAWKARAADFLRASNLAGIAFGNAGCAAVHAMSYPLGGQFHIPHGEANQLMFAAVLRRYQKKDPTGSKLAALESLLAEVLDVDTPCALDALYTLMDTILARRPLRDYGVTDADVQAFVPNVIETQQRLLKNNYTDLTADDMLAIYRSVL